MSPQETLSQALMPRRADAAPHSNATRASTAVLHDSEPTQTFDDAAAAETDRNPGAILALSVLPVRIAAVMHHEIKRLGRVILRGQHQGRPTACGVLMRSVWIGPGLLLRMHQLQGAVASQPR